MLFKSFVALAALATFAVATPAKRQFTPDGESCEFVLSTATPPDESALLGEFNFSEQRRYSLNIKFKQHTLPVIGSAIASEVPSGQIFVCR